MAFCSGAPVCLLAKFGARFFISNGISRHSKVRDKIKNDRFIPPNFVQVFSRSVSEAVSYRHSSKMSSLSTSDPDKKEDDERPVELRDQALRKETMFSPEESNTVQEVLFGEGGCADCSALSSVSACSNISQLISEEDLIDSFFHSCDTQKSGQVPVSKLLDYIKYTTQAPDDHDTNDNLEDLWLQFDPNGVDISVDINTCRRVMTQWVSQVRRASGNEFSCHSFSRDLIEFSPAKFRTSNLDSSGGFSSSPLRKTSNISASDCSTFESMEMHGKDASIHNIELMAEISELEFQNKKLQSRLLEIQSQNALVDDQNTQLTLERDELKKKLAGLQRTVETNCDVVKENLDLKIIISNLEENLSAMKAENRDLEKICQSRIDEVENELSLVSVELENLKAEKEILVQTNKNQLKLLRKERKEYVKAREKIKHLKLQLQDCERQLVKSRKSLKSVAAVSGNRFLSSPISGLLTTNRFDKSPNVVAGSKEGEIYPSIHDEILNLNDEFDPRLQSPFCEKFGLSHILEMDRSPHKFVDNKNVNCSQNSQITCAVSGNSNGNEGSWLNNAIEAAFVGCDTKVDSNNADMLLICRKGNFIQHLCTQLLIRHWTNSSKNVYSVSPARTLALLNAKTSSPCADAATQAGWPEGEIFADLRSYACLGSDVEDWSYLHSSHGEATSNDGAELLSILRLNLDKIEAIVRILLTEMPATNTAMAMLKISRAEQQAVVRNPPIIRQQVSRESNNLSSFDSGLPTDLSPSSPECSLKLQKWPKESRHPKQVLTPDSKSRSLDQNQGREEARTYRRALSCPVLQSKCILVSKGSQTDVSCVQMTIDDERILGAYCNLHDGANAAFSASVGVQPNSFLDAASVIDMSTANCPSHGSHKLPMLPEEHEDPSSPLPSANVQRHTSQMFVSLRVTPPPYRPPPPPPPRSTPHSQSSIPSSTSAPSEDHGRDQTHVDSSVQSPRLNSQFPNLDYSKNTWPEESTPAHRQLHEDGDQERKHPDHLLRRLSSKRRLGFEGSSTVIQRSAAVELDEFDTTSVDACEATASNCITFDTHDAETASIMQSDLDRVSEEQTARDSTPEARRWSVVLQSAVREMKRRKSSLKLESFTEPELEDEFNRLSLANRLDKSTLGQRLEIHQRQRDLAEKDVEKELIALKSTLSDVQAKSQTFSDAEVRHALTQIRQRVDVIQGAVARVSGRAEAYGVIQKEKKNCHDFALLIKYAEIEKNRCKQLEKQLEEVRQMNQLLSNQNTVHQLISSSRGSVPRSILLNHSPLLSRRRRASVAIDSRPALEGLIGLCTCPKAEPEAQGTVRMNKQCPVHSMRLKSGRRSSICAAIMPICSSQHKEKSSNTPTITEMAPRSFGETEIGGQETKSISEPCVDANNVEASSKENVYEDVVDENNDDMEEVFFDEDFSAVQSSRIYEQLDSLEYANDEDDDAFDDDDPVQDSPGIWTNNSFPRTLREAEIRLNLRYFLGGLLILTAFCTLFSSFFPHNWPYASGTTTATTYVPCSWYTWDELLRPHLRLMHHSSPPV